MFAAFDTFDVGVDLQSEARREGFASRWSASKRSHSAGSRLFSATGGTAPSHRRSSTAQKLPVSRASSLRNDPCGGFEAYLAGFEDQREAEAFVAQAKARGFDVVLERN